MAEQERSSEDVKFDPVRLGDLETHMFKCLLEGKAGDSFQAQIDIYQQQFGVSAEAAEEAVVQIKAGEFYLNSSTANIAQILIYSHYTLITMRSTLNFDPEVATDLFLKAHEKSSSENPVPAFEAAELFGHIYSVPAADLRDAMNVRNQAFLLITQEDVIDWDEVKVGLVRYYELLKAAVDKPSDQ